MNKSVKLKEFGLLVTGILISQLAFPQKNYLPGYVIKNNNDTLFGFVDYRNWEYNPDKIEFKTSLDNNPVSFSPSDIIEFKVEGEIYVSGIINTEISPRQTNKLNEYPQVNLKVDTTFLQTLISGDKSLYYYKNKDACENFYIKHDAGFNLLIYKRYLKQQYGKSVITENRNYLNQLTLYLNDCETIKSKLENTSYEQNSLLRLFQYYYKNSPADMSFQREMEKVHLETGVLAGVSSTSLEFPSSSIDFLGQSGFDPSINFSYGIFIDLILPRNQGKWSINNEILISGYNVKGNYSGYDNENNYSEMTTEIGYSYLKINNLVRYKYPIGHLFLFLNVGFSNGFSINETNYMKLTTTEGVVEGPALDVTRKYEQAYILGTGIKYNKLSLEFRYEKGNGMSAYKYLNSLATRYYFLLGYRF
jgi:hypothetical protein